MVRRARNPDAPFGTVCPLSKGSKFQQYQFKIGEPTTVWDDGQTGPRTFYSGTKVGDAPDWAICPGGARLGGFEIVTEARAVMKAHREQVLLYKTEQAQPEPEQQGTVHPEPLSPLTLSLRLNSEQERQNRAIAESDEQTETAALRQMEVKLQRVTAETERLRGEMEEMREEVERQRARADAAERVVESHTIFIQTVQYKVEDGEFYDRETLENMGTIVPTSSGGRRIRYTPVGLKRHKENIKALREVTGLSSSDSDSAEPEPEPERKSDSSSMSSLETDSSEDADSKPSPKPVESERRKNQILLLAVRTIRKSRYVGALATPAMWCSLTSLAIPTVIPNLRWSWVGPRTCA